MDNIQIQLSLFDDNESLSDTFSTSNLLTLKEAGKLLGVTWQTVRNYIKDSKLEAVKLNQERDYRISPDALKKFIIQPVKPRTLVVEDVRALS